MKINDQKHFLFIIFVIIIELQPIIFLSSCNASMGSITVKGVNSDVVSSANHIKLSNTTIKTLASQERNITINDVSGTLMVTDFSSISTSTTLNSTHNGLILVSGNITLTLPDPSSAFGIRYTIKKTDTSSNVVTISGNVDGESNPQLTEQYSYITFVSDGLAW